MPLGPSGPTITRWMMLSMQFAWLISSASLTTSPPPRCTDLASFLLPGPSTSPRSTSSSIQQYYSLKAVNRQPSTSTIMLSSSSAPGRQSALPARRPSSPSCSMQLFTPLWLVNPYSHFPRLPICPCDTYLSLNNIQYTYYTLTAFRVPVPISTKAALTALQIAQFFIGLILGGAFVFVEYDVPS